MSVSGIQGQVLEITVVGCNKLKNTEWQDPYVRLDYASGGKHPTFQDKFVVTLVEGLLEINVTVWNRNKLTSDDFIGDGKEFYVRVTMTEPGLFRTEKAAPPYAPYPALYSAPPPVSSHPPFTANYPAPVPPPYPSYLPINYPPPPYHHQPSPYHPAYQAPSSYPQQPAYPPPNPQYYYPQGIYPPPPPHPPHSY